jgi:hypothetical protein
MTNMLFVARTVGESSPVTPTRSNMRTEILLIEDCARDTSAAEAALSRRTEWQGLHHHQASNTDRHRVRGRVRGSSFTLQSNTNQNTVKTQTRQRAGQFFFKFASSSEFCHTPQPKNAHRRRAEIHLNRAPHPFFKSAKHQLNSANSTAVEFF